MNSLFTRKLLTWNRTDNKRLMPWKGEKDPYKIWLSEIILQQTRVEQGLQYYNRFVKAFPTVKDLANAAKTTVYKLWEGLGYYSRCKNLLETATVIVKKYKGKFPASYNEIRGLKGIGDYTAAAICSFAYNLPYAVVDGNVIRVLSRYFGITTPANNAIGKKMYAGIAQSLLAKDDAGIYNQAIMDFGAIICKPRNPLCLKCVQKKECQAFENGWVDILPVKEKKAIRKQRWFYYFVFEIGGAVIIRQRTLKDIWENLFEFVLLETDHAVSEKELLSDKRLLPFAPNRKYPIFKISDEFKQQLTHQTIRARFIWIKIENADLVLETNYQLVPIEHLNHFSFPRVIANYVAEALKN